MDKEIKNSLIELGFKQNEIKIYLALTELGEATATEVAKKVDLPRTTTIGLLNKLKTGDFLTTHQYRGKIYYWIESPQVIVNKLKNKIKVAEELNETLRDMYRSEAHFPSAEIYDTKSGIKNFIEKTLLSLDKNSVIYTIDAPDAGNYIKIYSEKTDNRMLEIKKIREIQTKTLVPNRTYKLIPKYKLERQNISIKELPAGIDYPSSLWLVGEMIVHFSGKTPFLVAVKHQAVFTSMKNLFDYLWALGEEKYPSRN